MWSSRRYERGQSSLVLLIRLVQVDVDSVVNQPGYPQNPTSTAYPQMNDLHQCQLGVNVVPTHILRQYLTEHREGE